LMNAPKKEKLFLTIERSALDDCLFAAVQEMIDTAKLPMTHRQKLRVADQISEGVMRLVDAESIPTPKSARTAPNKRRTKAEMEAARAAKAAPLPPADNKHLPSPFGAKAA